MIYGVLAGFETPEDLLRAIKKIRESRFTLFDAYTPFPIEGLDEALGIPENRVGLVALGGGACGATLGFGMQWYANVVAYPMNIAGKPDFSWPAFIPVTFELTILTAALFGALGMLVMNGLPRLYHPIFAVAEFRRASKDRFFICIEAADPLFDVFRVRSFLESLGAMDVREVAFETE